MWERDPWSGKAHGGNGELVREVSGACYARTQDVDETQTVTRPLGNVETYEHCRQFSGLWRLLCSP